MQTLSWKLYSTKTSDSRDNHFRSGFRLNVRWTNEGYLMFSTPIFRSNFDFSIFPASIFFPPNRQGCDFVCHWYEIQTSIFRFFDFFFREQTPPNAPANKVNERSLVPPFHFNGKRLYPEFLAKNKKPINISFILFQLTYPVESHTHTCTHKTFLLIVKMCSHSQLWTIFLISLMWEEPTYQVR